MITESYWNVFYVPGKRALHQEQDDSESVVAQDRKKCFLEGKICQNWLLSTKMGYKQGVTKPEATQI